MNSRLSFALLLIGVASNACVWPAAAAESPLALSAVYLHLNPYADPRHDEGQRQQQLAATFDSIAECGFNTLFCYANTSAGQAYYPSTTSQPATTVAGTVLPQAARLARERQLSFMPVVCVLVCGHDHPTGILTTHTDWALRDEQDQPLGWISPAHPTARAWIVASLVELVDQVQVDGLILDYFRWPNRRDVKLDTASQERFDAAAPDGETAEQRQQRLQRLKEQSLTLLLSELRQALLSRQPRLQFGLYTWGAHVATNHPVAQPWPDWVADGQLGLINVSGYCYRDNYGDDFLQVFESRLRDAATKVEAVRDDVLLTFALGLRTSHGAIPQAAEIADYLRIASDVGYQGVAAFAWRGLEPMLAEVSQAGYFRSADVNETALQTVLVEFDLDSDRGQNFGTLFEAFDANGQCVAGAGFLGAYNTYYRADRHALQVFVRWGYDADPISMKPFARPSAHTLHYLHDEEGTVLAADRRGNTFALDDASGSATWQARAEASAFRLRIGSHRFECHPNRIRGAEGNVFLFDQQQGTAGSYYYAAGHLIFHIAVADSPDRQTRLVACPWDPDRDASIELARGIVLELTTPGEFPYSYGQLGNDVYVGTNTGGVYRFRQGRWQMLVEPDMATSYQLYTMLNYHDRLLMGHYPSGELYEPRGDEVRRIEGWPPRPQRASPRAREAQTLTLYRGELFVGVWPWGEVWRYRPGADAWELAGRLFEQPAIEPDVTAPYESQLSAAGAAVNNLWGQRVTSLIPSQSRLLVANSNKQGTDRAEHAGVLSDDQIAEYGAVYQFELPGHLSIPLEWKTGQRELRFAFHRDRVRIELDGRTIGTIPLQDDHKLALERIQLGEGVFGAYQGAELKGELIGAGE